MRGSNKILVALLIAAVFAVPIAATISTHESDGSSGFTSYYDQLDANGKAIFDALNSADADTTSIVVDLPIILTAHASDPIDAEGYVSDLITSTVGNAFKALRLSSPLAFWGWTPSSVPFSPWNNTDLTITGNTATITTVSLQVSFGDYPVDPNTKEFQGIEKMLDDLNAAIDKFSTSSTSLRGKVLDINNYLVNLVTYDPNAPGNDMSRYAHDAYGALVDPNHYAVCDGYSEAFLLLCEKEGIDCVIVLGTGLPNLENHAWNYVKMDDGKWYAIDVTWNDDGNNDNPYFLDGGDTFFSTHQQGVFLTAGLMSYPFNSPALSSTGYDVNTGNQDLYSWILAAIIVMVIVVVLYRYARNGS